MLPVFHARIRLTAMLHLDAATHVQFLCPCPTSLQGPRVPQQCDGGMFPCRSLWSRNVHFLGACRPIMEAVRGGFREETEQFHHCDPEGGRCIVCVWTRSHALKCARPFFVWGRFPVRRAGEKCDKTHKQSLVFSPVLGPTNGDHFPGT